MGHPLELSIIENSFIEEWINQSYAQFSETIVFKGHIMTNKKQHLDPSKKWTSSILIITVYHLIIFSDGKDLTKKLPKEYHIYDCKKLSNKEDYCLSLTFQRGKQKSKVIMKTEQMNYIVSLIRRLRAQLDSDHCISELKLNVRDYLKQPLERKEFTNFEGFLDLYRGWCSYFSIEPSQSVIDYTHKTIIDGNNEIDLNELETSEQSELSFDQIPFLFSLKHNNYFSSLIIKDLKKEMSVKALAELIQHNSFIKKLIVKKTGCESLQTILSSISGNKKNSIQILDISENNFSKQSISSLISCMTNFNHSLIYLNISNCSIPPKMMSAFFESLEKNYGMSLTLEYLNISNNKLDDSGNSALTSWIIRSRGNLSLKNFMLAGVGVSSQTINALRNLSKLEYIDLSFNKIESNELERLYHILTIPSLYRVDFNYCNLSKEISSLIFSKMSEKKINVHLELAGLNIFSSDETNWDMLFTNMLLFKESQIKIKCLNLKLTRGTEKTLITLLNTLGEMKIDDLILDGLQLYNPQTQSNGSDKNGNINTNSGTNIGGSNVNSPLNSPYNNFSPIGSNQNDDLEDEILVTPSSSANSTPIIVTNSNIGVGSSSLSVSSINSANSTNSSSSSFISTNGSSISLLSASMSSASPLLTTPTSSVSSFNSVSSSNSAFLNSSVNGIVSVSGTISPGRMQIKNLLGNVNNNNNSNNSTNSNNTPNSNDLLVANNKPFKQLFIKALVKIYNNPDIRFLGLSEIGKIITSFIPTLSKTSSVISLDISGNGVGDIGANLLSTALTTNRSLININIDCNLITHVGWSSITRAIAPIDTCSYDILVNTAKDNQTLPSTNLPPCLCSMSYPKYDFERVLTSTEDIQQRTVIYMAISNLQLALHKNGETFLKNEKEYISKKSSSCGSISSFCNRTFATVPVGYIFKRFIDHEQLSMPVTPTILYPMTPIPTSIAQQINDKISHSDSLPNPSALYSIIATLRDPYYKNNNQNPNVFTIYTNNVLLPTRNSPIPFVLSFPDDSDEVIQQKKLLQQQKEQQQQQHFSTIQFRKSGQAIPFYQSTNVSNSPSNNMINTSLSFLSRNNSPSLIKKFTTSDYYIQDVIGKLDSVVTDCINSNNQDSELSPITSKIKHIKNLDILEKEKDKYNFVNTTINNNSVIHHHHHSKSTGQIVTSTSLSSLSITSHNNTVISTAVPKPKGSKSFIEEGTNKSMIRKSINGSTNIKSEYTNRARSSSVFNPISIIQNRIPTSND
ncbi:hypothetical protein DICPUDRAFT_97479 [Dictyostelium purpureum]|uniref:Leucine-rich repeat-containing protein n=1 Tax=Dictyostelium purpureum TaxID=5786 RepID=F0ZH13_DICPU|nr:uncharacterized protein DICPUDRAFT_97479 [Dictyostelium purpureum]EGC36773.1 hypothetical protein DICPUDRAFT_97479 [Dictyostelium purpureum]|eukprot:XP_003286719.1 hypothetical protein DICPUDRAFT_97479 [Dictyostelium purpureum]